MPGEEGRSVTPCSLLLPSALCALVGTFPSQSIDHAVAAAAGGNQVVSLRTFRNPFPDLSDRTSRIAADPGCQLPAADDHHFKIRDVDLSKVLKKISPPRTFGVGADFVGFVAGVGTDESGETRAKRTARSQVGIGDLRFHQ
jgi:hypothetical protein